MLKNILIGIFAAVLVVAIGTAAYTVSGVNAASGVAAPEMAATVRVVGLVPVLALAPELAMEPGRTF